MSTRILFYIQRNLQMPFLEPIHEQLCWLRPDLETAFCSPPFIPPQNGLPGWGLEESEVQRLSAKTRFVRTIEEFQPDITVFADACTNLFNCGKRVFVGHGIISKGGFYTDNELVRRENLADLICVPGVWHKEILEKNVFSPIVVTGFIKSDRLFGTDACARQDFCRQYRIPSDATIILYAPTFNAELSAIPCLGEQIALVCEQPDRYLVIKLHTMTDVKLVALHRQLANKHPRIRYVEDIDVTPAMAAADILISDVSSVLVEFMTLNRPVIAVNNPRQQEYEGYRPDDIEYRVRDACLQVDSSDQLLAAVEQAISRPQELSHERLHYAEALCFGRDGKSAKRAAQAILSLADAVPSSNGHYCLLLSVAQGMHPAQLLYELGVLLLVEPGMQLDVIVWGMEPSEQFRIPLVKAWLPADTELSFAVQTALACSEAPLLVLFESGMQLPQRTLSFLSHYFRWEPELAMVRMLTVRDDYRHLLKVVYPELGELPVEQVAMLLVSTLMGRSVPMEYAAPGCCMLRRDALMSAGIQAAEQGVPGTELIRRLFAVSGKPCKLALDLFAVPRSPLSMDLATLEHAVDDFSRCPDDLYVLNRLLTVLAGLGCFEDLRLIWQQAAGEASGRINPIAGLWGML